MGTYQWVEFGGVVVGCLGYGERESKGESMSEVRAGDKLIGKGLCANCGKWIYQKSLGKYNLVVWHHATGEQVCVGKGLCCKYAELKQKRGTQ